MLYGNFEPLFLDWQIALQVTSSIDFKSQLQTTDFEHLVNDHLIQDCSVIYLFANHLHPGDKQSGWKKKRWTSYS